MICNEKKTKQNTKKQANNNLLYFGIGNELHAVYTCWN